MQMINFAAPEQCWLTKEQSDYFIVQAQKLAIGLCHASIEYSAKQLFSRLTSDILDILDSGLKFCSDYIQGFLQVFNDIAQRNTLHIQKMCSSFPLCN